MDSKPVIATFKNHFADRDNGLKNWLEVCYALSKPLSTPKDQAQCWAVQLSGLKTKAAIIDWGEMSLLWVDLDSGNLSIDEIKTKLDNLSITSYGIYAAKSSTDEDKRWRILIEIKKYIGCDSWFDLQEALQILFNSDCSAVRLQQIMYAPNKGQHYEYYVSTGIAIDSTPSKLLAIINDRKAKRAAIYAKISITLKSRTNSNTFDIQAINDTLSTDILLKKYGYKRHGRKWISPNTSSGKAGLIAFTDGRWFSHHASDQSIGLPVDGGVCGDAFDLITFYEYGNNRETSLASLVGLLDPEGNKQRQFEYAKQHGGSK